MDLQERPHTLTRRANTHSPHSNIFTSCTASTQPKPNTIYSQQPIFSNPTSLDSTRNPQLILAPPLSSQSACINSTASSSFTLPLGNPPILSNLSTFSLTSFSST